MTRPTFSDPIAFPAFQDLPAVSATNAGEQGSKWWLIGQVKENMTITKPTLIVTDRNGEDFAVTFEDSVDLKPWRKGSCLVVPQAWRMLPRGEGKKGFVNVPAGRGKDVKCVSGGFEVLRRWDERNEEACGGGCGNAGIKACTGCEVAKYCGKDCQVKGWSERGHKVECKGWKSIREIWIDSK